MIVYHTIDKANWERGPWDNEPDKAQWTDEATGLPCLIVRNSMGALCGYVGVSSDHPWHGRDYNDCGNYDPEPEGYEPDWYPDVHGGLTYSAGCAHGEPESSICHIPEPGQPDDVWWLGFDCAHSGDKSDMAQDPAWRERWPRHGDVYRDFGYVRAECARLAALAAKLSA